MITTMAVAMMGLALAGGGGAGPSPAADEAFRWFGTLGFPDIQGKPLVKVATGEWMQHGSKPPENRFVYAFLLSEDGDAFKVLTTDLFVRTFKKTPGKTPEHQRVGFEKADLAEQAGVYLTFLKSPARDEDHWRRFGERLQERAEVFFLAFACFKNSQNSLAQELFDQAAALGDPKTQKPIKPEEIIEGLQRDLGYAMTWRAVLELGDPAISRKDLLARFEAIVKNYPKSERAEEARSYVANLRRMVQEDQAHPIRPLDKLPVEEQVAELIFALRDQNGQQWSQPGACDIFLDPRGEKSPAHQLVKIGYQAVPKLIEAISDDRLTRSVGYHRDFYFSHYILRVGDAALAILESIAGRSFYQRSCTGCSMTNEEQTARTRQEIEAWWSDLQKKGEKGQLVEAVEKGDRNSPGQAELLARKYPEVALAALAKGLQASKEPFVRTNLVIAVAALPGDASVPLLLKELAGGPFLATRVEAARGLHARKKPEPVPAMIREWMKLANRGPAPDSADGNDPAGLIGFLAGCGKVEAIQALGADLGKRTLSVRLAVLSALREGGSFSVTAVGAGGSLQPANPGSGTAAPAAALQAEIEKLLISELDDTEERTGMSGTWDGKEMQDPRLCDIAGHVLSKRWPDRYTFDLSGSLKTRDQQRLACQNLWRAAHHLKALPSPAPRPVVRVAEADLKPLLAALVAARTPAEAREKAAPVERLGPGALPALVASLATLDAKHPARAEMEGLARWLSCTIQEVKLSKRSAKPDSSFQAALDRMWGQTLTAEGFIGLLVSYARAPAKGAAGIRIEAVRDEDLTGVSLTIELISPHPGQKSGESGWSTAQRVTLGPDSLHGSSGSCGAEHAQSLDNYKDFKKPVDQALASSPEIPFIISASIRRE